MNFYEDEDNVNTYIEMAEGYDGAFLIEVLRQHLAAGSSVLELGMGPGKDWLLLNQHFNVTGSDASSIFVARFREQHTAADVIQLDAITMATDRQFDAIYSNKVLYHLTRGQLEQSLEKQQHVLHAGGFALHSFWYGEGDETMHGLHFAYYNEQTLRTLAETYYDVVQLERYTEMDADDSLYLLLRKRSDEGHK
jgi:cyclopropane fatty-acyl-phospholipid synthase-like methyltransferase